MAWFYAGLLVIVLLFVAGTILAARRAWFRTTRLVL